MMLPEAVQDFIKHNSLEYKTRSTITIDFHTDTDGNHSNEIIRLRHLLMAFDIQFEEHPDCFIIDGSIREKVTR
jgi:hypothetical protein